MMSQEKLLISFFIIICLFSCKNVNIEEYNHNSSINKNIKNDTIIEKIIIPTH
jgi:hypothetical protein